MVLTKKQISQIKKAWAKAARAELKAHIACGELGSLITKTTGIEGTCDYLAGDGHGFTPESNNDTYIYLGDLIKLAEEGQDITEELILDYLTL